MFDVTHKYRGGQIFFATLKPGGDNGHPVYLSGYGQMASDLLEKYVDDQRADNEELFSEWDKSIQEASSTPGFSAVHEVEDGYVYVTTFQNGIGISPEEEAGAKRFTTRGRRRRTRISILSPDLSEGMFMDEEAEEEIRPTEEIEDGDIIDDDQ